jgi:hypothetical protein
MQQDLTAEGQRNPVPLRGLSVISLRHLWPSKCLERANNFQSRSKQRKCSGFDIMTLSTGDREYLSSQWRCLSYARLHELPECEASLFQSLSTFLR